MNDPGLDAPIQQSAKNLETEEEDEDAAQQRDEELAFLNPSRWWFASTAFPLLAGTFGPMASAFSICALVHNWRVDIPPGGTEEHGIDIKDPKWLIAINAVSLVLALIANLALLMNMARRVAFRVAQPITIIGWYISSFLLIALVASASYDHNLKLSEGLNRALTQAFYYGIMAASLYFIVASLMLITVYGTWKGHYDAKFELTVSQRTLMLQTISFMVYLLGGAAVYSRIEGWQFLDAVYWADFTLLTVGIGDYSPMTHLGRGLLFPYAIGGIVIIGLVIGSIRSLVLERGKEKIGARMIEKKRESVLKRLDSGNGRVKLTPLSRGQTLTSDGMTERERRQAEFNLMRDIQNSAIQHRKWTSLAISGFAWFALWFVGAAVFFRSEKNQDWTYFQCLYFAYTSLLTIGYGDFYPQSNSGKPFFVFWSLLAVPALTILISNMGDTVVKGVKDLTLYLGEFTVLPGEKNSTRQKFQRLAAKFSNGKITSVGLPGSPTEEGDQKDTEKNSSVAKEVAGAAEAAERTELDEADEAERRGDQLSADRHHFHYLLIKEIRIVMEHLNESPPRRYTYDEWSWFLKLIGEDEASASNHRAPNVDAQAQKQETGTADFQGQASNQTGETKKWSWLGTRSPLMGEKEEAHWVLERLSTSLENRLKQERDAKRKETDSSAAVAQRVSRESSKTLDQGQLDGALNQAPKV